MAAELKALSALDDRLCQRLEAGDIRLLRTAYIMQPSVERILCRQELEELERQGESPLLSPNEAVSLIRQCDRSAGALT